MTDDAELGAVLQVLNKIQDDGGHIGSSAEEVEAQWQKEGRLQAARPMAKLLQELVARGYISETTEEPPLFYTAIGSEVYEAAVHGGSLKPMRITADQQLIKRIVLTFIESEIEIQTAQPDYEDYYTDSGVRISWPTVSQKLEAAGIPALNPKQKPLIKKLLRAMEDQHIWHPANGSDFDMRTFWRVSQRFARLTTAQRFEEIKQALESN